MSKTPFSNKCAILGELWCYYRNDAANDQAWDDFFSWADVALPAAFTISIDMTEIKDGDQGQKLIGFIDEAFEMLCEIISVDAEGKYENLQDVFEASPNPPLETVKKIPESTLTVAVINKDEVEDEG